MNSKEGKEEILAMMGIFILGALIGSFSTLKAVSLWIMSIIYITTEIIILAKSDDIPIAILRLIILSVPTIVEFALLELSGGQAQDVDYMRLTMGLYIYITPTIVPIIAIIFRKYITKYILITRIKTLISKNKIDSAIYLINKRDKLFITKLLYKSGTYSYDFKDKFDLKFLSTIIYKLIKSGKYEEVYNFILKCLTENIQINKYISKEELFEIFLKIEKINNTSEILKIIEKLDTSYKIYFLENLIKLNKKDIALGILSNKNILKDILLKSYEDLRNIIFELYYENKRIKEFTDFFVEEKDIYKNENLHIWLVEKLKERKEYEFALLLLKNRYYGDHKDIIDALDREDKLQKISLNSIPMDLYYHAICKLKNKGYYEQALDLSRRYYKHYNIVGLPLSPIDDIHKASEDVIDALDKEDKLQKISLYSIPQALYPYVILKLKNKKYYQKVKEFMKFYNYWVLGNLDLHKIWIETCVCLNEQNNIMNYFYENVIAIKEKKEILDFYYKKAVEFEEIGDYKTASIILEAFVSQDIKYRDALTRYQKLLVKLEFNNISDRKIGTTKKIKENDLTQTSALSENINDKYEFIREIGRGGMGIVYEAWDKKLNRKVAIKKLKEELSINPRDKKRFIEEAQNVANFNHPNIISIYDIVEEGKDVYIVFEFIDGKTVNEILSETNKINIKKSIYIIKEVCKALSYSHSKNIVHRDIKPSNIMIANPPVSPFDKGGIKEGFVKVMDFGIARELKDTLTRLTGMVDTSGTFSYMSPEQHLGKFYKSSDIYSLGITFYEMICGELPFKGPDFITQKRELAYKSPKEIIKDLPQEIENIVSKCLNNDLEKRYKSADELLEELERIEI